VPNRSILAVESLNGVDQIVRVDPSSGASTPITSSAAPKTDPAYTGDPRYLVYSDAGSIVFDDAGRGGAPQTIARSGGSTTFSDPMITEDVKRLVVEQTTACSPQPCTPSKRVTLFTLSNNEAKQIGRQGGFDPALSPDGTRVAMIEEGALVVYTITAPDPNGTRAVVADGPGLSSPAWSPDGGRIAFTQTTSGVSRIATVGAGGEARTVVSQDTPGSRPSWGRDGQSILFVQGDDTAAKAPLSVVNANGSGLRGVPGPARDAPAW
jgi:Tol biopolymer transport system component